MILLDPETGIHIIKYFAYSGKDDLVVWDASRLLPLVEVDERRDAVVAVHVDFQFQARTAHRWVGHVQLFDVFQCVGDSSILSQ